MSSIPSPLDAHAAQLNQRGSVLFLEHTPTDFFHSFLAVLQFNCAMTMAGTGLSTLAAAAFAFVYRAEGGLVMLAYALLPALLTLASWVGYKVVGWARRRNAPPVARMLELSRFGLRVSEQHAPTPIEGPFVDRHGRALLPWTAWSDATQCAVHGAALSFALLSAPNWIELSMTTEGAQEARALAVALWTEAHRPIG